MDPLLHLVSLQMSRTPGDAPEAARRRENLLERDRAVRARRAERRRERVWQAVALLTARRWRCDHELAGRAG